jgi:hypothetical protein
MPQALTSAAFALLLQAPPLLACAGCREPGEDVEASTVMAGFGFSWGVIIMLAFLFSLCGGLGAYTWRTIRAVDAENAPRG